MRMDELKGFVKGLMVLGYDMASIGEVFEDIRIVNVNELVRVVNELGIKEVVSEYDESFEFIDASGKYIEICGVC